MACEREEDSGEKKRRAGKKKLVMLSRLSKGDQNAPRRVKLKMKQQKLGMLCWQRR